MIYSLFEELLKKFKKSVDENILYLTPESLFLL